MAQRPKFVAETELTEETWRRAQGNQRFRERKFVQSGKERERLIALGRIIPAKKGK